MRTFPLRIGTPDGLLFEGEVQRLVCRSITGDLAIMAGHCNFCTALGMGEAHAAGSPLYSSCNYLGMAGGHRRRPCRKSKGTCTGEACQGWSFR